MKSDIVIVGGGAAGLMAAYAAATAFASSPTGGTVTVLEKMPKPGRKMMITGKGRCNFTNVKPWEDFSEHVRTNPNFISPSFHNLSSEAMVALLKEYGLRSVVERGDRAFPESHLAGDVVDTLVRACTLVGVRIVTGCEVKGIERVAKGGFRLDCTLTTVKEFRPRPDSGDMRKKGPQKPVRTETTVEPESYLCQRLIIATGGLSYPGTGSTGDGLKWAESLGIPVTACLPSLTALVPKGYKEKDRPLSEEIREAFARNVPGGGRKPRRPISPLPEGYPKLPGHIERITPMTEFGESLNGTKLDNVNLSLFVDGQEVQSEFGDLEFTDGGLEGPLGFMVSRRAVAAVVNGQRVSVAIDLKPAVELERLDEDVHARWQEVKEDPRSRGAAFQRLFRILLGKLLPWSLTLPFLRSNPGVTINTLAAALKGWKLDIEGFVGFERAVITSGGVDTEAIVAKSLEARDVPGLYFAGEVLDIDADTGGYNLQLAFSTGHQAGQSAALSLVQ